MRKKLLVVIALTALFILIVTAVAYFTRSTNPESATGGGQVISNRQVLSLLKVQPDYGLVFVTDSRSNSQLMSISGALQNSNNKKLTVVLSIMVLDKTSGDLIGTFATTVSDVLPGTTTSFGVVHAALNSDQNITLKIVPAGAY